MRALNVGWVWLVNDVFALNGLKWIASILSIADKPWATSRATTELFKDICLGCIQLLLQMLLLRSRTSETVLVAAKWQERPESSSQQQRKSLAVVFSSNISRNTT